MRPGARRTRRREGRGSRGPAEEQFHGRGAGRGGEDVDGFGDQAVGDVGAGWGGGVPEGEVLQAAADLGGAVHVGVGDHVPSLVMAVLAWAAMAWTVCPRAGLPLTYCTSSTGGGSGVGRNRAGFASRFIAAVM